MRQQILAQEIAAQLAEIEGVTFEVKTEVRNPDHYITKAVESLDASSQKWRKFYAERRAEEQTMVVIAEGEDGYLEVEPAEPEAHAHAAAAAAYPIAREAAPADVAEAKPDISITVTIGNRETWETAANPRIEVELGRNFLKEAAPGLLAWMAGQTISSVKLDTTDLETAALICQSLPIWAASLTELDLSAMIERYDSELYVLPEVVGLEAANIPIIMAAIPQLINLKSLGFRVFMGDFNHAEILAQTIAPLEKLECVSLPGLELSREDLDTLFPALASKPIRVLDLNGNMLQHDVGSQVFYEQSLINLTGAINVGWFPYLHSLGLVMEEMSSQNLDLLDKVVFARQALNAFSMASPRTRVPQLTISLEEDLLQELAEVDKAPIREAQQAVLRTLEAGEVIEFALIDPDSEVFEEAAHDHADDFDHHDMQQALALSRGEARFAQAREERGVGDEGAGAAAPDAAATLPERPMARARRRIASLPDLGPDQMRAAMQARSMSLRDGDGSYSSDRGSLKRARALSIAEEEGIGATTSESETLHRRKAARGRTGAVAMDTGEDSVPGTTPAATVGHGVAAMDAVQNHTPY